jgi:hypothetical protein
LTCCSRSDSSTLLEYIYPFYSAETVNTANISDRCRSVVSALYCSFCSPEVGTLSSLGVCPSNCNSLLDACADSLFAPSISNPNQLTPCTESTDVCSPASKISSSGPEFCAALGIPVGSPHKWPSHPSSSHNINSQSSTSNPKHSGNSELNALTSISRDLLSIPLCYDASFAFHYPPLNLKRASEIEKERERDRQRTQTGEFNIDIQWITATLARYWRWLLRQKWFRIVVMLVSLIGLGMVLRNVKRRALSGIRKWQGNKAIKRGNRARADIERMRETPISTARDNESAEARIIREARARHLEKMMGVKPSNNVEPQPSNSSSARANGEASNPSSSSASPVSLDAPSSQANH